jgi:hypothetical protein
MASYANLRLLAVGERRSRYRSPRHAEPRHREPASGDAVHVIAIRVQPRFEDCGAVADPRLSTISSC